ncbi:MAG: O-antigen ligase family protein [Chloroflexota bacterium]
MPTKLSRYCEGVMEAGWLAVLIVVPVFFNVYSIRIFEPDKITLLRTLTLIILGAWLVKEVETSRFRKGGESSKLGQILRTPLVLPVVALGLVYVISTIFSVNPHVSLWGSYVRLQGAYTTFSYILIFFTLICNLRSRAQVDRLVTTVIMASLPVCLYGVMQHFNLDPIPWGGDVTQRIAANMGNSIFVAAYLIMVIPLTILRNVETVRDIRGRAVPSGLLILQEGAYLFALAVQLAALYLSGSRGPWLGFLAGVFFLFVFLTNYWRKRLLTLGIVGVSAALGVFLVLFNIPQGPLESLRTVSGIGRLGRIFETSGGTGRVRVLIWESEVKLATSSDTLTYPDGSKDVFKPLRLLVGYGPESISLIFNPFYPPELAHLEHRNASPDRSHNETWDAFITTGLLGLGVHLVLYSTVFFYGLKWLGLIVSKRQRGYFGALLVGGGTLGAVGMGWWQGWGFVGVGIPFGMILGMIAYLAGRAVFAPFSTSDEEVDGGRPIILMGLLAAIVAHFVEIHFGIAIAVTRLYFWVFSAVLLVVGCVHEEGFVLEVPVSEMSSEGREYQGSSASGQPNHRRRRKSSGDQQAGLNWGTILVGAWPVALLMATLGFDLISNTGSLESALRIIWSSLIYTSKAVTHFPYGVLLLMVMTWVLASIISLKKGAEEQDVWKKAWFATLGVSGGLGLAFWLLHAKKMAWFARVSKAGLLTVIEQVNGLESLLTVYYLFVVLLILLAGFTLVEGWPERAFRHPGVGVISLVVIGLVVSWMVIRLNLRPVQANMAFKFAELFSHRQQWPVALSLYEHAIELDPDEDFYYLFKGRAYIDQAQTTYGTPEYDSWMEEAEDALLRAQQLNPLNPDHTANLARLHSLWASSTQGNDELRQVRGETSSEYYAWAVTLSPNNAGLWDEWGSLYLHTLNQPEVAVEYLLQASVIDPEYDRTYALLGDYYLRLSDTDDPQLRQEYLHQAIAHYQKALALTSEGAGKEKYSYTINLGASYAELGDIGRAISTYIDALQYALETEVWRVEEVIARLYLHLGDKTNALLHAQYAWFVAPEEQKPRLQIFVNQLYSLP